LVRSLRSFSSFIVLLSSFPRRHPEEVLLDVVVALFQLRADGFEVFSAACTAVVRRVEEVVALRIAELRLDLRLPDCEGIRDVFEEDQAKDGVLIDGGVQVGAEPVCGGPELFVEVTEELLGGGIWHVAFGFRGSLSHRKGEFLVVQGTERCRKRPSVFGAIPP
jgi:hypothetical protein